MPTAVMRGRTQHDPVDIAICTGVGVIYRTDDGQNRARWAAAERCLLDAFVHNDDFYAVDDTDHLAYTGVAATTPTVTATPTET